MKQRHRKQELTDLEKADCLTGKQFGGIVMKDPGSGKRRRFIFEDRTCHYHTMSRVTGGDLLFGDVEKEAFRKIMRRMERFSGVEILTYAVMGNHFHLLLRVPERARLLRKFTDGSQTEQEARLLEHLKALYSQDYLRQLKSEHQMMREQGMESSDEAKERQKKQGRRSRPQDWSLRRPTTSNLWRRVACRRF